MQLVRTRFSDDAHLRDAAPNVRAVGSRGHAELARGLDARVADGEEAFTVEEVVLHIDAVLREVDRALTQSYRIGAPNVVRDHRDSGLQPDQVQGVAGW